MSRGEVLRRLEPPGTALSCLESYKHSVGRDESRQGLLEPPESFRASQKERSSAAKSVWVISSRESLNSGHVARTSIPTEISKTVLG